MVFLLDNSSTVRAQSNIKLRPLSNWVYIEKFFFRASKKVIFLNPIQRVSDKLLEDDLYVPHFGRTGFRITSI